MSAGYLAVMFPKREELTTVLSTLMPADQYAVHVPGMAWSTPARVAKGGKHAAAAAAAAAAADANEPADDEATGGGAAQKDAVDEAAADAGADAMDVS